MEVMEGKGTKDRKQVADEEEEEEEEEEEGEEEEEEEEGGGEGKEEEELNDEITETQEKKVNEFSCPLGARWTPRILINIFPFQTLFSHILLILYEETIQSASMEILRLDSFSHSIPCRRYLLV